MQRNLFFSRLQVDIDFRIRPSFEKRQHSFRASSRFRISPAVRSDGGRGRIRTSVARKERQIYSLLVLATHPPVRTGGNEQRRSLCVAKFTETQTHFRGDAGPCLPPINWDASPDSKI